MIDTTLETFQTVARLGSFSEASRRIDVPASTISRQMSRLEEELGVQLLNRSTREVTLTEAGRVYLAHIEPIVERLRQAEQAARELHAEPQGTLRVALPLFGGDDFFERVLAGFMQRYPDVRLDLFLSNRVVDLIGERIDVALRTGNLTDSTLRVRQLVRVRRTLVASPAYLEAHGVPQSVEELEEHACLVYSNPRPRWPLRTEDNTLEPVARMRADDLDILLRATLAGHGLAVLPELMVQGYIERGELKPVLEEEVGDTHGLFVVWPSGPHMSAALRAFVDHMVEVFEEWAPSA